MRVARGVSCAIAGLAIAGCGDREVATDELRSALSAREGVGFDAEPRVATPGSGPGIEGVALDRASGHRLPFAVVVQEAGPRGYHLAGGAAAQAVGCANAWILTPRSDAPAPAWRTRIEHIIEDAVHEQAPDAVCEG